MCQRLPVVVVGLVCLFCQTLWADGLLQKLPEDKTWAKYDLELTVEGEAATQNGSLTLKSVGSTFDNGEKCRFVEMEMKVKPSQDSEEQTTTFKLLLPEKNLKAGSDPLEKVVRGWYKVNDQALESFTDTSSILTAPPGVLLAGTVKERKPLDKQFEDSKLGNLECGGYKGEFEHKLGDGKIKLTCEMRTHEKAPFGSVRAEYGFELGREGNADVRGTLRLKLADFGTDATSALPDVQ